MSGNGRVNADHVTTSKLRFKWVVSQTCFDLLALLYFYRQHLHDFFLIACFLYSQYWKCNGLLIFFLIHISHSSRIWLTLIPLACLPANLLAQFLSVVHLFVIAHMLEHPFRFAWSMVACLPVSYYTDEYKKLD